MVHSLEPREYLGLGENSGSRNSTVKDLDTGVTTLQTNLAGQPWQQGFVLGSGINAETGGLAELALNAFTVTPATSLNSSTNYSNIFSSSDVDTLIKVSASGSYNMDGVNINASASVLNQVVQSDLSLSIIADYSVYYNDYDTIDPTSLSFTTAAQTLIDQGDFNKFRSLYGDYYISGHRQYATFTAVYTVTSESQDTITDVQVAIGANAPEMFTAEGQATFKQAISNKKVSVSFSLQMQGVALQPATPQPAGSPTIDTVNEWLIWFQQSGNTAPVPYLAEFIHYSQIDNTIPITLPIDPVIFTQITNLYLNTYILLITFNSLPASWQLQYNSAVTGLITNVQANQANLSTDSSLLVSLTQEVDNQNDILSNLYQRYLFLQMIVADQSSEPGIGSSQSQTGTYGSTSYNNAGNDPDFVIYSVSDEYNESGHVGHRDHNFNLSASNGSVANGTIVQWQLNQNWNDGTDGTWWKNSQQNNSDYILLNSSANVHCKSEYDRGFDNTLTVWFIDSLLVPPSIGASATESLQA